jgi:hypothetical protein
MRQTLDLEVATPEEVIHVLRAAADKFRESTSELQSAWQDQQAGKVWSAYAAILDRAAASCERARQKHLGRSS